MYGDPFALTALQHRSAAPPSGDGVHSRSSIDRRTGTRSSIAHGRRQARYRSTNIAGLLPQPPDDREKYSYIGRHVWVLTCCSLVSFSCLAVSQFRLAQSTPWLWVYLPFLLFTILYYLVSLWVNAFSRSFDLRAHRRLRWSWRPAVYPTVDVFLPVCGEPLEVLHNTWSHVARMARHYPGVVTPYVLDDVGSGAVAAMASKFGFVYGTRPNRGWFKKAGNLHYGFGLSSGEYVLILDADFAPRPDLLDELLPYMDS